MGFLIRTEIQEKFYRVNEIENPTQVVSFELDYIF